MEFTVNQLKIVSLIILELKNIIIFILITYKFNKLPLLVCVKKRKEKKEAFLSSQQL